MSLRKMDPRQCCSMSVKSCEQTNEMILLVIQDITERKLFEEQRNQLLTQEQSARSEPR